ncbi:uncharacterized protein LOC111358037 [Spodoptera litura]|uniref:Uncharacterized protein LOC111358037 n=1 Tax=Spodoptera litura TaxID=69820 RepID=A0A9J7IUG0_SPOLT|nr:uncharacterized protein LOC111358037 [Spodoptera litura]
MFIYQLPLELLLIILINIDGISLGKCRRVCKRWREIIDNIDCIWRKMCLTEYKYSSFIARKKSGEDCEWYHLYRNITTWEVVTSFDIRIRDFYKFAIHDKHHLVPIDYGILPLKQKNGLVFYDMQSYCNLPATLPDKDSMKVSHNDYNTALLLKSGVLLQRTVECLTHMSAAYFTNAQSFVLTETQIYFFKEREVFVCDLKAKNLESKLMLHCDYEIKQIQSFMGNVYLFTTCGKIVSIEKNGTVTTKAINIPPEWMRQIRHMQAIDDRNYVCYSRNIFKIETEKYQHLYLEFPPITALFFYGDFILIGTRAGEILLYRLSSQQADAKPNFEKLTDLPEGRFAVQLEVCERKWGPVIIVATYFDVIIMEIDFFPEDKENKPPLSSKKLFLIQRLMRVQDRMHMGLPKAPTVT